MRVYYEAMFALSIIITSIFAIVYKKRFNVFTTMVYAFVPLSNLGYLILNQATNINEAIAGVKLSYIGGCYLNLFMVLAILNLSDIFLKKSLKILLFLISTITCLTTLTIGNSTLFYKSISGQIINGSFILTKEYGPFHTFYYIKIVTYLSICFAANIYSIRKKNTVSTKITKLLLLCEFSCIAMFFGNKLLHIQTDLMPLSYIINETILLVIVRRIGLSDVTGTVIDAIALNGETGFVSFDASLNYIGSNFMARKIFPELSNLQVDKPAYINQIINEEIIKKINDFNSNEKKSQFLKKTDEKIFKIEINRMYDGHKNTGYILYMQDDTKDQKYISLLNKFNDKLRDEVAEKTEHIVEMHNQLIMGMATMVESRDNSTGGHIKRTSEVVRILLEEIQKDDSKANLNISADFCHNLIKAAPMHDLGKIAVDDSILRKPGRFTPEEFEKMKTHAAEGARIVHEILKGTDEYDFHILAENVAHYHHERWDGSGYPEGLAGNKIPLEARIMAVADVYDALVSKRVYKEAMSFEQADKIMQESFGKHFDRQLEKYYTAARPKLEKYYELQNQ